MRSRTIPILVSVAALAATMLVAQEKKTSYSPVVLTESFAAVMQRMTAAKPGIMSRQKALLEQRYDLADRPAPGAVNNKPGRDAQRTQRRQRYVGFMPSRQARRPLLR